MNVLTDIHGTCLTCGKPLLIRVYDERRDTGEQEFTIIHDRNCSKPSVSLWTDNPRKLGVITGIT